MKSLKELIYERLKLSKDSKIQYDPDKLIKEIFEYWGLMTDIKDKRYTEIKKWLEENDIHDITCVAETDYDDNEYNRIEYFVDREHVQKMETDKKLFNKCEEDLKNSKTIWEISIQGNWNEILKSTHVLLSYGKTEPKIFIADSHWLYS